MSGNEFQGRVLGRDSQTTEALCPLRQKRGGVGLGWWQAAGLGLLLLVLGGGLAAPVRAEDGPHLGFLYDDHALTLDTGFRAEALGPFFYSEETESVDAWGVPPLFSRIDYLDINACEYDFAYPLLTYGSYGSVYRWQVLQFINFAGGHDQSENERHRFTIFPIYFQQRSADSNQNYTALFPIYGHLKNRVFRSEITFFLWPLYSKTVKRPSAGSSGGDMFPGVMHQFLEARRGDMTTHNFLLPFFHLRYGDGLFGWQAWPLLGHEAKEITTKTNSWGDVDTIPGHDKRFFLWPFYLRQHRGIGGPNPEHELLVFPLYNRLRSPLRDSTSYLTPFGLTIVDDRARKYQEVDCPWPLITFAWGEGKTTRRVFPFFSQAQTAQLESDFYLWPAYTYRRQRGETLDRERTRSFFFLFSRTSEKNTETGKRKVRTDLWPLYTHKRGFEGQTRLQILALLEPILPTNQSIERNYSPLWTLWRSENNPKTGGSSQSLLWNLYRHQVVPPPAPPAPPAATNVAPAKNLMSLFSAGGGLNFSKPAETPLPAPVIPLAPPTKKVSLLFGLFQYQSTGENRQWRLFYVPLNRSQKVPTHVPEHR
jgi:hypothetical protein